MIVVQCATEHEWHIQRAAMINLHMAANVYGTSKKKVKLGKTSHGTLEIEIDGVNYQVVRPKSRWF